MCQNFWLPRATVANLLQLSEVAGRAERGAGGRGLRQGQLMGAAMAQKEGEGKLGVPACGLLQVPAFRQSLHTIPPSFKTAASHCWPLLPEGMREQEHQ